MSDDVVTQFPGLPQNPLQVAERRDFCGHDAIRIDRHDRTVVCARCGATLDAFDYLANDAARIQHAWELHHRVMREVQAVGERVGQLKKLEQSLRAKVKRLHEKSGESMMIRPRPL